MEKYKMANKKVCERKHCESMMTQSNKVDSSRMGLEYLLIFRMNVQPIYNLLQTFNLNYIKYIIIIRHILVYIYFTQPTEGPHKNTQMNIDQY